MTFLNDSMFFVRLDNGWYVRDAPSPTVQTGGTSSTVPSTPPSDTEYELLSIEHHSPESLPAAPLTASNCKQTKKVTRFLFGWLQLKHVPFKGQEVSAKL